MPDIRAPGQARTAPSRDAWRQDTAKLPCLVVRYFRQMKLRRVYAVEVSWQKSKQPSGERRDVTVRLFAPGALVVPAECTLNAAEPNIKAVFHMTPLANGRLRQHQLEVLSQGLKIQQIQLPARVASQRLSWVLLLLTFLVPWLLVEHVKNSSLGDPVRVGDRVTYTNIAKQVEEAIKDNVPVMPEYFKDTPVERSLLDLRHSACQVYQQVVLISRIEPLGFYAGLVLLTLTLISAFLHRQKRGTKRGKALTLEALTNQPGTGTL